MQDPEKLTHPRERQHHRPECILIEGEPCSYKTRKNVREAKQIGNEDSLLELEHGGPSSRVHGVDKIPSILTPSTVKGDTKSKK